MKTDNLTLLQTISHEFKTPLHSINSILQTIDTSNLNIDTRQKIVLIHKTQTYLNWIVDDIIEYSENKYPKNNQFNDKIIIYRELQKLQAIFELNENKNAFITKTKLKNILYGDKKIFLKILATILARYNSFCLNDEITLTATIMNQTKYITSIKFKINNHNKSINEDLKNIFFSKDILVQTKNSQYFNLGFNILVQQIKQCDGELLVIPCKENNELAFFLNFRKNNPLKTKIKKNKTHFVSQKKLHILLAEDNKLNQLLTKKFLARKNINCTVVNNGLEAIIEEKKHPYDLILMDIMMPKVTGYEAIKEIRKNNSTIPVIALTTLSNEFDTQKIKRYGFNTKISKPFEQSTLLNTIYETLKNTVDPII
ncbi:MAG: response regulator [Flavobacteriales bacterium]